MADESTNHDIVPHPYWAIVNGGIRSIVASVPVLASLGQAWNEYATHRTTRRIQELMDNLQMKLEECQRTVPNDPETLGRHEDFPELLEIAIEKVAREFDEAKRSRYAQVLARLLTDGNTRAHDEKVALLESMDFLSEADLRILSLFQGIEDAKIADLRWREAGLPGDLNDQLWEMSCSLARLESRGLVLKVATHTGAVYVQDPQTSDAARWEQTKYRVMPLGRSLIAVLFK